MKVSEVKKGEKVGFHQTPSWRDCYHVRGKKADCLAFAAEKGLTAELHSVSGDMSPVDEVYGIVA